MVKPSVRALLIDPEQQTITEIQFACTNYKDIQRRLGCDSFTSCARLNGNIMEGFDSVYVSDDFLEDRPDGARFWFQIDADRKPPSSHPINGLGLVHGTDRQGEMSDARISVEELTQRVTFTQRKFKGFKVETFDPVQTGLLMTVDVVAPIIDGTSEESSK